MSIDQEPEVEDRGFISLPLDQQRMVIDYCIANNTDSMTVDGRVYELPNILQITYKCSKSGCNNIISARFFRKTVINRGVSRTRYCTVRGCRGKMYISHKTAVLDYYLGDKKKKKRKTRGLMKYLAPMIDESIDTYGDYEPED